MEIINVALGGRSYNVHIENGALANIAALLEPYTAQRRLLFITDANVHDLYWQRIRESLSAAGVNAEVFILPAGEASKSWQNLEAICDWLIREGTERADHIVALGGGVIGDIAGFASAIVKRGCNFVQIPTTLLAQVDSSVGGKTAINSETGKNLVGLFHQPAFVLIDPDMLDTLPERELRAGYAEVVKYGLIGDADFFAWCEGNGGALLAGDKAARIRAISHSINAKAQIVSEDERELSGRRALLNLGHTFGHALEAETGFGDILIHGEAVAAGMALAARYSVRRGYIGHTEAERIAHHLVQSGLPASLGDIAMQTTGTALAAHMQHDKKVVQGDVPLLLMRSIGDTFLSQGTDLADVAAFLGDELANT
ncbi:3-dehydroquinate synthase [Sphingorhabdus sp. Alg239-R122]|uniref:3-dehydroquinate synthase n=1 Tax=Sphingorhabdus sp. Alg239-R122 TaxID=2305989 RepID=UPI0013DB715D|nr:3-dehydroquinate synthase [Sphingorhabdus sp. Alg239-R122]